jgi:hypothetical protein
MVIDRGARAVVFERDDVLRAVVNQSHLVYAEDAKIFAVALP